MQVSIFLFSKAFSLFFLEHPMIKLQSKRFELNFLLKLSDLKSNSMLTLGYLNPDLNNLGQIRQEKISCKVDNFIKKYDLALISLAF